MGKNGSAISNEILVTVAQIASNAAIEYYKEEVRKAEKKKESDTIKKTKEMLQSYRRVKARLNDTKTFTDTEKAEYRWKFVEDLMGDAKNIVSKSERIIKDEEKKRQEDMYALYRIDNAIALYKRECELSNKPEEKRKFRIINKLYIDDTPASPDELMEMESISRETYFRDVRAAIKIVSIYLYGI